MVPLILILLLYAGVLVVVYTRLIKRIEINNLKEADKSGFLVIHSFQYSWVNGVCLTPNFILRKNGVWVVQSKPQQERA